MTASTTPSNPSSSMKAPRPLSPRAADLSSSQGESAVPAGSRPGASVTHADISQRAYDLYVETGYVQGRCRDNWFKAVNDLRERGSAACQAEHRIKDVFAPDSIDAK